MSVRFLLSVVFAVALVAAVGPAVEDARHARGRAAVDRAATTVVDTAAALVATGEPPPAGDPGARRTVTLRLPANTALAFVGDRVLAQYVDGRRVGVRALPVPVHIPAEPSRVRGRVVLTVAYERRAGTAVLVVTRGFMREGAAKEGYASAPATQAPTPAALAFHTPRTRPASRRPTGRRVAL